MLLRPRITIAFLLVSVVPVFFIGASTYSYVKSSMEQSVLDGIHIISQLKETNLLLYLEKIKTATKDFASDGFVRDGIESITTNPADKEKESNSLSQYLIKNKIPLNSDVLSIDVLTPDGIIASSTILGRVGVNHSKELYYLNAKKSIYINDIRSHDEGVFEIDVASPLFSQIVPEKLVGILVSHFTVNSIKDLFNGELVLGLATKTQSIGLGTTGETYLVNKDKLMINDSRFIDNASFHQLVDTYPVKMSLEQELNVSGIWKDYRGIDVVGESKSIHIGDFKWTLITEQDVNEAFVSVENIKKTLVIIILIVTIVTLLTSIFISRMITRPIGLLTSKLEALGKGEKYTRITEIRSNDEIGFLARTFELMSLNLSKALNDVQEKNQQLEELSNRDGLTGIFNHRHLKETLEMEFNRSFRYNVPLCCIMLDIDFFKSINDTYGHLFGDVVLKGVAAVIKENCRKSDITARYGGEEFVVLLPNTELEQARIFAEKLNEVIKTAEYSDDKNTISITVSVGVSFFHDGIEKYTDMLAEADQAMYEAKNSGRNKICVFKQLE